MSFEATKAVWETSEAKGSARMVLLCIAYHVNGEGTAWPSMQTIADETKLSTRQVSRAIAELVACGELLVEEKGNGRGRSSVYRLDALEPAEKGDAVSSFCSTKDDIYDIKDDILSIKDDTMSSQLKELKENDNKDNGSRSGNDYAAVVSTWENEMGYLVTPVIAGHLTEAMGEFGDDGVIRAIGIASAAGVRTWKYVNGVLRNVRTNGWGDNRNNGSRKGQGRAAIAATDELGGAYV